MKVEQVDFVSVPTRDVARAVAFYRDVLGLPESEYAEGEVEAPNVTFGFWSPEAEGEEFVRETLDKPPSDTGLDDQAGRCAADLSLVPEDAKHHPLDDLFQVGVVEDDDG